jgi:hypothetical protein
MCVDQCYLYVYEYTGLKVYIPKTKNECNITAFMKILCYKFTINNTEPNDGNCAFFQVACLWVPLHSHADPISRAV